MQKMFFFSFSIYLYFEQHKYTVSTIILHPEPSPDPRVSSPANDSSEIAAIIHQLSIFFSRRTNLSPYFRIAKPATKPAEKAQPSQQN